MRIRYSFSSRRTGLIDPSSSHARPFPSIVKYVIRISDIVLEVIDARFIEKTRNIELEELIKKMGKKLIYVLNKSDLADTNQVREQIKEQHLSPYVIISCKTALGKKNLRERIKIEVSRLKIKHAKAHIGIIGYPNTGKSTLINVLAGGGRSRAAAESGFTKGMQKIRFSKDIIVIDTPGVISFEDAPATQKENISKTAEIGVKTFSSVKNPELIVAHLMKEYHSILETFYGIESKGDAEILIEELGKKLHFLKKGGHVDHDRTARLILRDWQTGKIKVYRK
ncbi:50S ribosome-binding GTPase [Candidatus Pacearchaeota archaeon]|nr:50S ribosome-binding GTPase [Candidatus Pacearchaeota archaeon]